jgi:cytochrome P450
MADLQDEVVKTFNEDFPTCFEWTTVPLVKTVTYNVARVASRMLGGEALSDNPAWVASSIGYATDGFIGAQALKQFPAFSRPLVKYFIPAIARIHGHYRVAESAILPILEQREQSNEKASDLLSWLTGEAKEAENDKKFIAAILLKISFAAMHTTAAALSQLIFDLCAMPEYIEPLREEICRVADGRTSIGKNDFSKLVLMDSIMKESQRLNPVVLVTFERYLWSDVQASDGTVIPAHTTVGVPAYAISMDPSIYPDPEKFDGYRFTKLKANMSEDSSKDSGKHSFASINHSSMGFGYGKHACPGRFFATNEIKLILSHLLMEYDFKLPEGQSRPQSTVFETQNLPDHHAEVLFRKR